MGYKDFTMFEMIPPRRVENPESWIQEEDTSDKNTVIVSAAVKWEEFKETQ